MKRLLMVGTLLSITTFAGAGAAAQSSCTDGVSGYDQELIDIGDDLSAASNGTYSEVLQVADQSFERLVLLDPPSAFEEQHAYMLSALHNLAMAGMAYSLDEPTIAASYEDAANDRLEQVSETLPDALASCGL